MSDWYWYNYLRGEPGDYHRGRSLSNLHLGTLASSQLYDKNKLKKELYRNDLLNQIDDNRVKKYERFQRDQLLNDIEEERLRRERFHPYGFSDDWYGWDSSYNRRFKQRIMDNEERRKHNFLHKQHNIDEDKYKYKRFRKGNEPVEAWWLDPHPYHPAHKDWWKWRNSLEKD